MAPQTKLQELRPKHCIKKHNASFLQVQTIQSRIFVILII